MENKSIKSVDITYDSRQRAKLFASAWALATMKGCDLSKTDKSGKTTVSVYDLTQANLETLKDLYIKY
jgi:uncharacterized protein YjbI with pentapeptide repeats